MATDKTPVDPWGALYAASRGEDWATPAVIRDAARQLATDYEAAIARAEAAEGQLKNVKATASELIGGLVRLIKALVVFADNLGGMTFGCRPVMDIAADLIAAESANEMLAAIRGNAIAAPQVPHE